VLSRSIVPESRRTRSCCWTAGSTRCGSRPCTPTSRSARGARRFLGSCGTCSSRRSTDPDRWTSAPSTSRRPTSARWRPESRVPISADLGRLLYEMLKAEFLYDYGENVEPADEPIADPTAERERRGGELVEELRDWVDGVEVAGVDLREVARRFRPADSVDMDRLASLIRRDAGRRPVSSRRSPPRPRTTSDWRTSKRDAPGWHRSFWRTAAGAGTDPGLGRLAQHHVGRDSRDARAGRRRTRSSVLRLTACLEGDGFDGLVRLQPGAGLRFEAAGERIDSGVHGSPSCAARIAGARSRRAAAL
jgi:hypothetical protein